VISPCWRGSASTQAGSGCSAPMAASFTYAARRTTTPHGQRVALAAVLVKANEPELRLVHRWLDSWCGLGSVVVRMAHQGWDLELIVTTGGRTSVRSTLLTRPSAAQAGSRGRGGRCRERRGTWCRTRRAEPAT
jgi:hypothetical protein